MTHWTEDDFKQWLYGLKERDAHADTCGECSAEFGRLAAQRRGIVAQPEVSEAFLREQRRNIYGRLEHSMRNFAPLRWAISIAVLLVVAVSLTLPRWNRSPVLLTNDEQLYSDIAAIEQTDEPQAIQPIHKLFEER